MLSNFGYLPLATTDTVPEAEHGAAKLPVAVQVSMNTPAVKVTVLVEETTAPLLSVHW